MDSSELKSSLNDLQLRLKDIREGVFDDKGNYLLERNYVAKPGKPCKFCEFYNTEHCEWGKIL